MSIDRQSAERVFDLVKQANALCDISLRTVMSHETLGIAKIFGRLTGNFLYSSIQNILTPIWKIYPNLEPAEMKEEYVESTPALSGGSKYALSTFVFSAQEMLNNIKNLDLVASDGIEELENNIKMIQDFIENPVSQDKKNT